MDLASRIPPSNRHLYLLTCVDLFTLWPEATPLADYTTPTIARAFLQTCITCFDVPSTITMDRGSQFESAVCHELTQLLGIDRHVRTTAYCPEANGIVEHSHHQLKSSLKAYDTPYNEWSCLVCKLLSDDLECSTTELVYGAPLRFPGEFFSAVDTLPDATNYANQLRRAMQGLWATLTHTPSSCLVFFFPQEFSTCIHVSVW